MNNSLNLVSQEIVKCLTSSLIFTCQNSLIYKYEPSSNFYDHKEISNDIYDFVVDSLVNLPAIFKYKDDKKIEISENILNKKFEYSKIIFDYYIAYFNLEFIKNVFYSDSYVEQLEKSLKNKIIDINKYIRVNSKNEFTDYLPYLLSKIDVTEFHKIASTISHEFNRFSFEQINEIYNYNKAYYTPDRLTEQYNGFLGEKFALQTIFETTNIQAPESNEKIIKVLDETEREVMDVIADLTLLYECLNDLNILITFITDESIIFENQLMIKDIFYTFKDVIQTDDSPFIDQLFELIDQAIENITDDSIENTDKILELLDANKELDETTEKLVYMLSVLKTAYSEDIFDYFVSKNFFDAIIEQ